MTILAFLERPGGIDFGRRFSRMRWRRAVGAREMLSLRLEDPASARIRGQETWVVVTDEAALPLAGPPAEPLRGRILAAVSPPVPPLHTLRELEEASSEVAQRAATGGPPCALCLCPEEHPPATDETVAAYLARVCASGGLQRDPRFAALLLEDPSGLERPELARRLPPQARRLLDIGCGRGGTSGQAKKRLPLLDVTGIEKDPTAAERARLLLDRVLVGDAGAELERLAAAGEMFDAFLFGDVLEHLTDPIGVLALARRIALPGATLTASVPNVGHLSLVRDLVRGRFDPIPAGLTDAGHLRWFDRRFLSSALEEAGWRVLSMEAEPGAPVPGSEEFLKDLASWPALDRQSLMTYQWIAVAVADGDHESDDLSIGSSDDLPRVDEPMDR